MIASVFKNIIDLKNREQKVKSFFISVYCIGFIGLIFPFSTQLFLKLTPYALLLSFLTIILFHQDYRKKTLFFFVGLLITGFFIEMIGVKTGLIFGDYRYGNGLGFKLWNTPLLIGMNWLLMVYLSASIISKLHLKLFVSVILAALIMLGYDIIMEQVASNLDMWYWENNSVPFRNYIAWFLIAVIFHSIIKIFRINTENKIASVILICHFIFFSLLFIFYRITP